VKRVPCEHSEVPAVLGRFVELQTTANRLSILNLVGCNSAGVGIDKSVPKVQRRILQLNHRAIFVAALVSTAPVV
jgi:hypothetical protein